VCATKQEGGAGLPQRFAMLGEKKRRRMFYLIFFRILLLQMSASSHKAVSEQGQSTR